MKQSYLVYVISIISACVFLGCANNQIIEKSEYQPAIEYLKKDNVSMAIHKFPKKEKKHFITLVEKVYLQLIDAENVNSDFSPEFQQLLSESRDLEKNEQTSIGNELDQLFFIKTNEGYYPANHEIFWMHFLLGMTFIKMKQPDKARIEAKRISELFSRVDMKGRPFYDNASLRFLAATLWIMCGEKDNAMIDLRRANLKDVYESENISWIVVFKGVGLNATVDTSSFSNKISGFKAIHFTSTIAGVEAKSGRFIFPSKNWHVENLARNEELKDTIQKSKYMSRMFKSELEYQSLNLLTSVATGTVLALGITVGVGIVGGGIYILANQASAGDLAAQIIGIGFLVGGEIYEQGMQFYSSTQSKIQTERSNYQDVSRFYRYVRFIPDYFILNAKPEDSLKNQVPFLQKETEAGKVKFYFQP